MQHYAIFMQHMFATEMAEQPLFHLRSKTKTIIELYVNLYIMKNDSPHV